MWLLVCEDDDDDFMLEKEWLTTATCAGGEIVRACDGVESLELLRLRKVKGSGLPRLVLLDLNMPRMGGFQVLREFQADPMFKPLQVIVMSTSRTPEDEQEARRLGAKAFLSKPASAAEILKAVAVLKVLWDAMPRA